MTGGWKRPDTAARNRAMANDPTRIEKLRRAWNEDRRQKMRAQLDQVRERPGFERKRLRQLDRAITPDARHRASETWRATKQRPGYEEKRRANLAKAMASVVVTTIYGPVKLRAYQADRFERLRLRHGDREALQLVSGKVLRRAHVNESTALESDFAYSARGSMDRLLTMNLNHLQRVRAAGDFLRGAHA